MYTYILLLMYTSIWTQLACVFGYSLIDLIDPVQQCKYSSCHKMNQESFRVSMYSTVSVLLLSSAAWGTFSLLPICVLQWVKSWFKNKTQRWKQYLIKYLANFNFKVLHIYWVIKICFFILLLSYIYSEGIMYFFTSPTVSVLLILRLKDGVWDCLLHSSRQTKLFVSPH